MSPTNPTYRRVNLDRLVIDTRYQRPLHEHRIGKMVDEWNPAQQGVLEVSKRDDGSHAVFDGQHRLAALKALGRKTAPCLVHTGLSSQDEANLFVRLQRDRRPVSPVERFKAQLFSRDPRAKEIAKALTAAGYKVGNGDNDVKAVASVERIAAKHGLDVLAQTFEIIRDAWFGDRYSLDGSIIGGLAEVVTDYGYKWEPRHTDRLRLQAPVDIKRRAQGKNAANFGASAALIVAREIRKSAGLAGRPPKRVDEGAILELVS